MKNAVFSIIAIASLAALIAIGCTKKETTTTDTSTTTASTDSTYTSSTSTEATNTSTSGTSGTTSTAVTPALNKEDTDFVIKVAEAGNTEVSEGQLAGSKASNADVKSFGDTMVSDHGKAGDELKSLATSKGVTLPTGPGKDGEAAINKLSGLTGAAFDKAYMEHAVKDHEGAVKLFEKESKDAKDPDLKTWATNTLPTLKHHLDLAKAAKKKVG